MPAQNSLMERLRLSLGTLSLCLLLSACASVVRTPLPEALHENVTVLGRSDFRRWGDATHYQLFPGVRSMEDLEERYAGIMHREHN
jgi:hypothetical protein